MDSKLGPDQGEKRPEIKVVDRRTFTSDGRKKADPSPGTPPEEEAAGKRGSEPSEPAAPPPPDRRSDGEGERVQGPGFTMDSRDTGAEASAGRDTAFLNLCVSLYESGCLHLGVRGQEDEQPAGGPNLEAARATVEMLEMLKRKTAGNLTHEEQKIIESLLAELQMAYVMKAPGA